MTSRLILAILLIAIVLDGVQSMPKPNNRRKQRHPGSKTGPDSGADGTFYVHISQQFWFPVVCFNLQPLV